MKPSSYSAQQYADLCLRDGPQLTLDVRSPAEVASESLSCRCHNLPLQELNEGSLQALMAELQSGTGQPVYFLCQGGQRARLAAEKACQIIPNPLVIVEGGINSLRATGINLQSGGGKVISLERQVRIAAGSLVLVGAILGFMLSPAFFALSAFVGAGLVFAGISDTCAMGMILARMPWNRAAR